MVDLQGSVDCYQVCQQCVVLGVLWYQQVVGVGVMLVCGDEGGLDDGVDGGVEVGDFFYYQWVVVVYFQCQDFLWLVVKLVVQQVVGVIGFGEEQIVEFMVGGQCDVGFVIVLDQVEYVGWQVGLDLGFECQFGDFWGQFVGFEYYVVIGQQCWDDMFVGQVVGEIVGIEYCYYVMWFVLQYGGSVGQWIGFFVGVFVECLY